MSEFKVHPSSLKIGLSWLAFPIVLLGVSGLHFLLKPVLPLYWSTQLPVLLGALVILSLEYVMPYRTAWLPSKRDYGQDALFMVLIQILLPKAVGFALVLLWVSPLQNLVPALTHLWPHHWPILLQMVFMMLLADLGRYWLHRWFHTVPLLWRFHAVHHSPQRLYWTNVGRFHPVDKATQLLLDTLPFMLLGVHAEVLALYFVAYAIIGFFQHCNIDVRLGALNYVFSGPELHRWHHSQRVEESNRNYGNNTIVWDTLFGTRFLPREREVQQLGLINEAYPDSFTAQLKTPFLSNSDKQLFPELSWFEVVVNGLLALRMKLIEIRHFRPLQKAAQNPLKTQTETLLRILRANQNTELGKRLAFEEIHSIKAYQEKVPVHTYDDLQSLILKQAKTGEPCLTAAQPVMYNQTSGTTGQPKFIPILAETLTRLKHSQGVYSYIAYRYQPAAFAGKLLGIVSPAVEGHLPGGQPYGSASGHLYQSMPSLARGKYVLPAEVFEIADYDLKYYVILRLALAEPTITYMGSANPSTFKKCLEVLTLHQTTLLEDLRQGTCQGIQHLPEQVSGAIQARLRQEPQRAEELAQIFEHDATDMASIWPHLKMISTWTGGSCQIALNAVRAKIPAHSKILELGYLSSEFRGTLTIDPKRSWGLPTLNSTFFEFVSIENWENETPVFLTLNEVEVGQSYYVFMTTEAGLYRYHMNDIVKITGQYGNTPTLNFVQKGKGVTSITGEKLYESQLIEAVSCWEKDTGIKLAYYLALADPERSVYTLYLETIDAELKELTAHAKKIEEALSKWNLEYAAKRDSGRLLPLEIATLEPGSYEAFKTHCLEKGQREGQFKIMALQYKNDFTFDWSPHMTGHSVERHLF